MKFVLFIFYYTIVLFMIYIYLLFRKRGLFSISDIVIIASTILVSSMGYFNSFGGLGTDSDFSLYIYVSYILYIVLLPIGLIIGNHVKSLGIIKENKVITLKKTKIMFLIIILYALYYFNFIGLKNIPLVMLFNGFSTREAAIQRLKITHNFSQYYKIPFLLRYYRLFLQDISLFIFNIIFLYFLDKKVSRKLMIFFSVLILFFYTYTIEKSGIFYVFLSLMYIYYLYKNNLEIGKVNIYKLAIITFLVFIVFSLFMYNVFMGQDFLVSLKSIFYRLSSQTSGVYYQNIILQNKFGGNLRGKGYSMAIFDSIIDRRVINLSEEYFKIRSPHYSSKGVTGTTGGFPMFYLTSNFGIIFGSLFFVIFSIITGIIDNYLRMSFKKMDKNFVDYGLYSYLAILFSQGFIGSINTIYNLPFLFSPTMIIIIFTYVFIKSKSLLLKRIS